MYLIQWFNIPLILCVKPSNKGFIIPVFFPVSLGPYSISLSVLLFALLYSVMVKWRNSGIISAFIFLKDFPTMILNDLVMVLKNLVRNLQ